MKVANLSELPATGHCNRCDQVKPVSEMVVQYLKSQNVYYLRPLCKKCHNKKERGHRREYKREYLRKWRKRNAELDRSYWKSEQSREYQKLYARKRTARDYDALAIQRRLRYRGEYITLDEAKELLKQFGRCYPTKAGLSKKGLAECERIRSNLRRKKSKVTSFEIRMMVYADSLEDRSLIIKPQLQRLAYPQHILNGKKARRVENEI